MRIFCFASFPAMVRNRHKRRGRFSCNSGFNCINNEVHEFDTQLTTGFGNRQNTFNKTTAGFTLSTETAFSPEHTFSQDSFCGVIGWFNTFNRNKGSHSFPVPEDVFTHAFSLFDSAPKTTSQKSFHSGFRGNKLLCESLPGYFSILEEFPKIEHPYCSHFSRALLHSDEQEVKKGEMVVNILCQDPPLTYMWHLPGNRLRKNPRTS